MAGWDTTQYQSHSESDFAEGEPAISDQGKQIGSNQEYFNAQLALVFSAWTRGDDVWDHFSQLPDTTPERYQVGRVNNGSTIAHDEDNHFVKIGSSGTSTAGGTIYCAPRRRADRVPMIFEARVRMTEHSANATPYFGCLSHIAFSGALNGVMFQRGTNANTYKAVTVESGTVRETTDNQSGNYTSWDILKIVFDDTDANFYINSSLVATHTLTLPTTVLLYGACRYDHDAVDKYAEFDWMSFRSLENSLSP